MSVYEYMYMYVCVCIHVSYMYTYTDTHCTCIHTQTYSMSVYVYSVLPRIFRVVVGFYIAFSAVYPVYLILSQWPIYVLFERWLIHLRGGYSRPVPTSVGRTLVYMYSVCIHVCLCMYSFKSVYVHVYIIHVCIIL